MADDVQCEVCGNQIDDAQGAVDKGEQAICHKCVHIVLGWIKDKEKEFKKMLCAIAQREPKNRKGIGPHCVDCGQTLGELDETPASPDDMILCASCFDKIKEAITATKH